MYKTLLSVFAIFTALCSNAQITITQTDIGTAGDSIVVGNDNFPPSNLNVGSPSATSQTWDFSSLSVSNINTLKFEDPANTASGSQFPNADLATERQEDTLFYDVTATEFSIDGLAGDPFGLGANFAIDFNPNVKQLEFPSTLNDNFTAIALFDSTALCAALGISQCYAARIKRTTNLTSTIDAFGEVETPGGTYTSIRQYLKEDDIDSVWVQLIQGFPFTYFPDFSNDTTIHYYRWYANNEDWPVLSATADGPNGNITSAEFKVDDNLISYVVNDQNPLCKGDCNGSAEVSGLGGVPPYSYQWPASTGGGTAVNAQDLCAGTYVVTIHDANGDSTTQNVVIANPEALSVSVAVQAMNLPNTGAIDLTVSGGSGTKSFAWSGPNGFTATTEDLDSISDGSYQVIVSDANGCDTTVSVVVIATGIKSTAENTFKMYPNPVDQVLTVETQSAIEGLRIYDLLGNLVLENNAQQSNKMAMNVSEIPSGLYLIEVNTADGNYLKKLTIQ